MTTRWLSAEGRKRAEAREREQRNIEDVDGEVRFVSVSDEWKIKSGHRRPAWERSLEDG